MTFRDFDVWRPQKESEGETVHGFEGNIRIIALIRQIFDKRLSQNLGRIHYVY